MSRGKNVGGGWGDDSRGASETWGNETSNSGNGVGVKKTNVSGIIRDTGGWGEAVTKATKTGKVADEQGGGGATDEVWASHGGGEGGGSAGDTWGCENDKPSGSAYGGWGDAGGIGGFGISVGGGQMVDAYEDNIDIAPVVWRQEDLEEFNGYEYEEHADVQELSEKDVIAWRNSWHMHVESSDPYAPIPKPIRSFEESKLPEDILKLIDASKGGAFENPTAIQSQGWPLIMTGKDVIGVAQTGSGKTLTFILPGVVHIRKNDRKRPRCPTVMIQAPTRELARQIGEEARRYSKGIKVGHSFGGEMWKEQELMLKDAQFVVGTPGRTMDHLAKKSLSLRYCTYVVLDEADRMLDMGFQPQVEKIFKCVRLRRQLLLFTATWPRSLQELSAKLFEINWLKVTIGALQTSANHNVDQRFIFVEGHEKQKKLVELLNSDEFKGKKTLIFVKTRAMADEICMALRARKISTAAFHSGKDQRIRDIIVRDYKKGVRLRVLIATDVAQRGLHVDDISLVVNYDYPNNVEDYVHRIGRTARSGHEGVSLTMFNMRVDNKQIPDLIKVLKEAKQPIPRELTCGSQYINTRFGPNAAAHNREDGGGRARACRDSQRLCYDFQKGSCKRGDKCRYLHVEGGSGREGGRSRKREAYGGW